MNAVHSFFNLVLVINGLMAAVPHPIQDAGNHSKCEFPQLPTGYLQVGKTVSVPGECMQITCHEDLTITGLTCPTFFSTFDCQSTDTNHYKAYPECCPQLECKFGPFSTNIQKRHTLTSASPQFLSFELLKLYVVVAVFSVLRTIL